MQTVSSKRAVDHYFWYFGPSGVRALPVAAGTNEGGHYFRYFSSLLLTSIRTPSFLTCPPFTPEGIVVGF